MRILFIYHGGEFPPAERIEKQANALNKAGHQVFLACNNYGKFKIHEEQVDNVHVIRIRPTLPFKTLNKILKFPIFFNPLWLVQLLLIVRKHRVEALQVIDVPLAIAALFVGKVFKIPVVYDMWENYPEALRGWGKVDWRTRIFKNYKIARAAELFSVRRADHLFTVVEEQKKRLIEDGVKDSLVSVVSNTVEVDSFLGYLTSSGTKLDEYEDNFVLFYVGGITIERGIDEVIKALPSVTSLMPEIKLVLAGDGNYISALKQLVDSLSLENYVDFIGWIPFAEIPGCIEKSDLCLIPHVKNDFIDTTIPNKLFQYMLLEKPVLVSNALPLARIVNECDCGYVFESGNIEDLACRIMEAYKNRESDQRGPNGRIWVEKKYNWEETSKTLLKAYSSLGA